MLSDLDQMQRTPLTGWTAQRVRARLVEACKIEHRLPGDTFSRLVLSSWPATPLHNFQDMLHWDDARQRVWDSWERARGAWPYEVSRMEEAMDWLAWLPDGERRCLLLWMLTISRGKSLRHQIVHRKKWSRSTVYRRVEQASARIADRLNREGVQAR